MRFVKHIRNATLVNAILLLMAGILFCLWPKSANDFIVIMICILIILNGIINLIEFLIGNAYQIQNKGNLILAILKVCLGIYLLYHQNVLSTFLGIIFGIYIIAEGCSAIEQALILLRLKVPGYIFSLILSFIIVIFGILLLFNPNDAIETMMFYIGISLIIDSMNCLISLYTIKKAGKEIWNELYGNDKDVIDVDYRKL